MAVLHDVHHGGVFTHLSELLSQVGLDLQDGQVPLAWITGRLDNDPVYVEIASGAFVSPVRQSPKSEGLLAKIKGVRQLIADSKEKLAALEPFLKAIENFVSSGGGEWQRKHGYFIVPVIDSDDKEGLVYLYSPRKQWLRDAPRKKLDSKDLTQNSEMVSHFGMLANVMLKRFFYVKHYPFDRYTGISDFAYHLHFGCQITDGKSLGAAVLAMYLLNYLQSTLDDEHYTDFVAPQVGTMLTGEIDPQGRVLRVKDWEKKVRCARREYGPELKIIAPYVPESERLPADGGNIFYVRSVEELMSKVLSTPGDPRGLDTAREGVFDGLRPGEISELCRNNNLLPNVPGDIHVRKHRWREPVQHELGIYSLTDAWNDRLDVALGPDAFSLTREDAPPRKGKKLIQVVLDGSAAMDGHWAAQGQGGVSRIAIALYEIARRIDPAREDLVFGFLSYPHFEPYDHQRYTSAGVLEPLLQDRRKRFGLRDRGAFMRPVRGLSIEMYSDRQKRIYVLSESNIPDLQDVGDRLLESFELLRLIQENGGGGARDSASGRQGGPSARPLSVFSAELTTNQDLLSRHFHKQAATLPEVEVDVGTDLPVAWEPAEATVSRRGTRYVIKCRDAEAIRWALRVRLANQFPDAVAVSGAIKLDKQSVNYSFTDSPNVTSLPQLESWREGELTAAEFELWRIIAAPEGVCPECRGRGVHLFHDSGHNIIPQLIFPSFAGSERGWLLLYAVQPWWLFFKTGCKVAGLSIALVDGEPHYSAAQGHLERVPDAPEGGGLYRLQQECDTFYLYYL
jgi:hypothetical protein